MIESYQMKKISVLIIGFTVLLLATGCTTTELPEKNKTVVESSSPEMAEVAKVKEHFSMSIESLRKGNYPGGDFVIDETLSNGSNFKRYITSYQSEGLKIYGLLMVPLAEKPEGGFPAVIFVHGHIPPKIYDTVKSYPTYPNYLARNGFVVFKPDLRGHGKSEGEPSSAHYSEKYTIDTLNALAYLKQYSEVNPSQIGYWGHSNGGEIGLRTVLVDKSIKAASFWAGVVGRYETMFETLVDDIGFLKKENPLTLEHGLPSEGGEFWHQVEPYNYLTDINIPIEIQHGTDDDSVPLALSIELKEALESAGKTVEYHEYAGDDHNIGNNSSRAWQRSIDFFKKHL